MDPRFWSRLKAALLLACGALLLAVEVRASCRSPPRIANGFIQIDRNYGQESSYLSRPGGSRPHDTLPTNFRWNAGDTILYSCHDGFRLMGNRIRICGRSGSWTGTEPQCGGNTGPRTCPAPDNPENGYITPSAQSVWHVGDSFRVRCYSGFEEPMPNYFSCRRDGTWSSGSVNCRRRAAICNRLAVVNGYVDTDRTNGWTVGTVVSVICYRGFQEPSPNRFECVDPGRWSPPRGICAEARPAGCPSPPGIENGHLTSDRNREQPTGAFALMSDTGSQGVSIRWNPNDVVRYECDQGYALVGSKRRVCTREGIWTGVRSRCEYIGFIFRTATCDGGDGAEESFCENPQSVPNGTFAREANDVGETPSNSEADRWAVHDMVKYHCDEGFALDGDLRRVCTCEGYWTGEAPQCLPSSYGPEGRVANAAGSHDAEPTPSHCSSNPCRNGCICEGLHDGFRCVNQGEIFYLGDACQYDPPGVSCDRDKIDVSISRLLVDGMNGGGDGFFYLASSSSTDRPPAANVGCRFVEYNLNLFLATIGAPFADCGIKLEPVDEENFSRTVTIWHDRSAETLPTAVAEVSCVYEGLYDVSVAIDALCCAALPLITANGVFHFQTSLWKDPPGPDGSDILPGGRRRAQVKGLGGAVAYTVGNMLYVTVTMNSDNSGTEALSPKLRKCWMSPDASSEVVPGEDLVIYPSEQGTGVHTWGPTSSSNAVHFGFQLHQAKESTRLYLHCQIEVVSGREKRSISGGATAEGTSVLTKGPIYVTGTPAANGMQRINERYGVEDLPYELFLAVCIFGTVCIVLLTICCYAHLRLLHSRSSERCTRLASVRTVS